MENAFFGEGELFCDVILKNGCGNEDEEENIYLGK
jgi:hypothetical protein